MAFAPKYVVPLLLFPTCLAAQHPGVSDARTWNSTPNTRGPATRWTDTSASPARTSVISATDTSVTQPVTQPPRHYWQHFATGFISSILLHEAGHVVTAYAVGGHPYLGFDKGRPTIYSGIDANIDPHKQFLFSSAGLNVQAVLDEGVLDVPHHKGSAFERGLLAGGIATAYFYATLGRNASNSDITYIARTSSLSKTKASLIYAGLATVHVLRIAHDHHYANFFMRPHHDARLQSPQGTQPHTARTGIDIGIAFLPE